MPSLSDLQSRVSAGAIAGLLLAASSLLRELGLSHPSGRDVLAATGARRSRAYELQRVILDFLGSLDRPIGRPKSIPQPAPPGDITSAVTSDVLRYVMDHPGCVDGGRRRRRYSEGFRKHILELREQHPEVDLPAFAEAAGLPSGTVEDWLRVGAHPGAVEQDHATEHDDAVDARSSRIQTVLAAYKNWHGSFRSFCAHVRENLRLDFGASIIAGILFEHGERAPKRRRGRSPDEEATRGSFETFFPGAQWVGDGSPIKITLGGECFVFNFELIVDADSGAFVGVSIRDEEDGRAVVEALEYGTQTTGEPPIALLLDNRSSNHTDEVKDALGETIRIRATKGRAQNKAHVEGAFGLFSQQAPELVVDADTPRGVAKEILRLAVEVWARSSNHRPRSDRKGKSRVELYNESAPTQEQIDEARTALEERLRRQQRARETQAARLTPVVRETIESALQRLGLLDPEGQIRNAIARYPLDAILDGIAIFEGKRNAQKLPAGVDARYLLGIVRNIDHIHEADAITEALIRERIAVTDRLLRALEQERDQVLAEALTTRLALRELVDRALAADRTVDKLFWLDTLANLIKSQPAEDLVDLFRAAARRMHACFKATPAERSLAERRLARALWPVQ